MTTAERIAPFSQETSDLVRRIGAGAAVVALALGLAGSCSQPVPEHRSDPEYPSETDRVIHVDDSFHLLIP